MFSLELVKQKKFDQLHAVIHKLKFFKERKRPIYPLMCDSSINIIAEVKKASPCSGSIKDVDPVKQATVYQEAGARAVSVLTDSEYFKGSYEDLYYVAEAVTVPVLCKEFICYPEQIDVAYNAGADMILLIAAMLDTNEIQYLYKYTSAKGLLPLIEVHAVTELDTILALNPEYLMVNVRNLSTLELEYDVAINTLKCIPHTIKKICASGIDNPKTLHHIKEQTGTTTFLVGTALMRSFNPQKLIQELSNVC